MQKFFCKGREGPNLGYFKKRRGGGAAASSVRGALKDKFNLKGE